MSDKRGQAQALTLLTPVEPGQEKSLAAALAALPTGAASPLARLPGTHFARFVVVSGLASLSDTRGVGEHHLLYTSCFDGELEPHLSALCELGDVDAVWGRCEGYPGRKDPASFAAWVRAHRVTTAAFTGGYLHAPLDDVGEALALRERLRAFAPRAQHMDAPELQAAFREAFPL